ncbi:type II toxin-antitoxin system VapC family toxin [Jiella sp. MQZ9-1]|uniref:Type II toxin-antitoxin system VapC family toxin n=1 Tax=Jiella flava TaxID=2816857 RepID=A0A939G053_9HYPH|nr:type II toxin-antitoxin system VapC family toxin [Jiella flava]MBO0664044.1 type II toxin-antitoxin system VapC family toxin [Jiella flava]MCD2472616.1 type II toxin-antitoxin system VapC family toxin [Jiella flava]
MNAVDTNVLLRYLVADDPEQSARATSFFSARTADDPAFVGLVVLVEMTWVLRRLYGFSRAEVHAVLVRMVETEGLVFEDEHVVAGLIHGDAAFRGELADHLIAHAASKAGCGQTFTFDAQAAKRVAGMELLT